MLLSIVPTDEVEFDDIIRGLIVRKYIFTVIFTVVFLICGLGGGVLPPFIPGLCLLVLVAFMVYDLLKDTYCTFYSIPNQYFLTSKISVGIILTQIVAGSALIYVGMDTAGFVNNSLITDTLMNNGWRETIQTRNENVVEFQVVYTSQGIVLLLSGLIGAVNFFQNILIPYMRNISVVKGTPTECLYFVLYAILFAGSFTCLVTGIMLSYHSLYNDTHPNSDLFGYLDSFFLAAPLLSVMIIGKDEFFSLMARSFELNISRLQKDGALLAELASQANINTAVGDYRFVHRLKEDPKCKNSFDQHAIDRTKWLKGEIISNRPSEKGVELCVRCSYDDDMDSQWYCKFTDDKLHTYRNNSVNISPAKVSFDQWVEANFDTTKNNVEVVKDDKIVLITEEIESSNQSAKQMLIWARGNLRSFSFANFTDKLLESSPRELVTNEDKEWAYNLSQAVERISYSNSCDKVLGRDSDEYAIKKINFFISHSWVNDPAIKKIKIKKLKEFSAKYKTAHNVEPTYWFDKTCIDQKNPKNALLSLPINIGACEKMLILLDKTYLQRLWCLWELYTIFSFCNKELAVLRVEVLIIEDDEKNSESVKNTIQEFKNFDINNCHCYGPDEEMKLRCIIHEVGIERLKHGITTMASILQEKIK